MIKTFVLARCLTKERIILDFRSSQLFTTANRQESVHSKAERTETKKELRCFLRFKLPRCFHSSKARKRNIQGGSYCRFFFVSPFLFFSFFHSTILREGKKQRYIYVHFPLFIVIFQSMEHDSRRLISISLNTRDNSSNFSLRKSRFLAIKFSQTILEYLANKAESWGIKINFHPLFKNIFRKRAPLTSKALLFVISPVFLSFFLFSPLLLDRTIPRIWRMFWHLSLRREFSTNSDRNFAHRN